MASSIDVGIINYNGGEQLLMCINSLRKCTGPHINIFVFDNDSSDNSLTELSMKAYSTITVITSQKNLGYAGACNQLLAVMNSEIVVLSNMDVEYDTSWAEQLIKTFNEQPEAYSMASLFLHKSDNSINWAGNKFFGDLNPQGIAVNTPYEHFKYSQDPVFGCYGAVMAFKKSLFDIITPFDEDYFLFYEETDLFWRLEINGLKTIFNPLAIVYHHRSLATVRFSPTKLYYSERNRVMSCYKYLPLWYFPLTFFYTFIRYYTLKNAQGPSGEKATEHLSKVGIIKTLLTAWIAGLWYIPREYQKRKYFWNNSTETPQKTLRLLKMFKLKRAELTL
ncbi:MAG: glycosyltransferase family 2 protein [Fibrobacterales bacterium]